MRGKSPLGQPRGLERVPGAVEQRVRGGAGPFTCRSLRLLICRIGVTIPACGDVETIQGDIQSLFPRNQHPSVCWDQQSPSQGSPKNRAVQGLNKRRLSGWSVLCAHSRELPWRLPLTPGRPGPLLRAALLGALGLVQAPAVVPLMLCCHHPSPWHSRGPLGTATGRDPSVSHAWHRASTQEVLKLLWDTHTHVFHTSPGLVRPGGHPQTNSSGTREVPRPGLAGAEGELFCEKLRLSSQASVLGPGQCPRKTGLLGLSFWTPHCWHLLAGQAWAHRSALPKIRMARSGQSCPPTDLRARTRPQEGSSLSDSKTQVLASDGLCVGHGL